MAGTPRVRLYFNSENPSGRTILTYLSDRSILSSINKHITIELYDTKYPKNREQMKRDSVGRIPTLTIGRKCVTGSDPIIGYFQSLVRPVLKSEPTKPEPEEEEIDGGDFQSTFHDRMRQLEERRNKVHTAHQAPPTTTQKKSSQPAFKSDDEFLQKAGEVVTEFDPSADEYALENYFNEEADKCGRKPFKRR